MNVYSNIVIRLSAAEANRLYRELQTIPSESMHRRPQLTAVHKTLAAQVGPIQTEAY